MKIVIDGKVTPMKMTPNAVLKDVLNAVADLTQKKNKVIEKILLDGKEIISTDTRFVQKNINEFKKLEIISVSPITLASSTLNELIQHLPAVREGFLEAAKAFNTNRSIQGFHLITNCINGIDLIFDAFLSIIKLLNLDLRKIKFNKKDINEQIKTTQDKLNHINYYIKTKDTVSLADICEYEMVDEINTWQKIISKVKESIQ